MNMENIMPILIIIFLFWWVSGTVALIIDFRKARDVTIDDMFIFITVFGWTIGNFYWIKYFFSNRGDKIIINKCEINDIMFTDKSNRKWESFIDHSYFDMICVRLISDRDFNSTTSFHFVDQKDAYAFVNLIKKSN